MTDTAEHMPRRKSSRLFYGYVIVGIAFVIHLVTFSLYDSFGVFVNPLVDDFGWSRAVISGAYSLGFVLMGVVGMFMGMLMDRRGPRLVLTICGLGLGIGFILFSLTRQPWQLYLFYGVIFGTGMSGIWAPLLSLLARWFREKRGLITGIVIAGGGIGALVGPPTVTRLIQASDWRTAALWLGAFILVLVVAAAQFLERDPAQVGQQPYGGETAKPETDTAGACFTLREAADTPQFWLVFGMLFCLAFFTFSVMVHIVPHAIELGIAPLKASGVLATVGGVSILGNFLMGRVCDKIGPRLVFVISFVLMAAALFWLTQAQELWGLYLFAAVFGFNHGGNASAQTPIVARLFGLDSIGSIFGVAFFGFTIGGALGPVITGHLFDIGGDYRTAFLVCAIVGIAGLALTLLLRPTPRVGGRI